MTDRPEIATLLARAIAAIDPSIEKRIDHDPQASLDLVVIAAQAHTEAGKILTSAVGSARAAGWSWEAIGTALGMSRQAAHQRFGTRNDDEPTGERKRIVGLNAANEMEALNEQGLLGWHSVDHGPLFHDLEKSDHQWVHRRVFVGSRKARSLEAEGWEQSGHVWFPWVYFKKDLGRTVDDEDKS